MIRTTFSIPSELKEKLDALPEINWPEVFKKGLEKKLVTLEKLKRRGEL